MASSTSSTQLPHHVSALLSHLTSRPDVQSTLILSRKDGSIIQTTGLLAGPKRVRSEVSSPARVSTPLDESNTTDVATGANTATGGSAEGEGEGENEGVSPAPGSTSTQTASQTQTQQQQTPKQPYNPSQGETLAAHIFSFVSAASGLSFALSHPVDDNNNNNTNNTPSSPNPIPRETGFLTRNGSGTGPAEADGERQDAGSGSGSTFEGLDDDEVKLLRLRTKKHEIVVVPDRKYLLCVVHDAVAGSINGVGAAATGPGSGGRGFR